MTKLLSLFDPIFGGKTKNKDLEQFINAHNPANDKDVEELAREYLYHYSIMRGL